MAWRGRRRSQTPSTRGTWDAGAARRDHGSGKSVAAVHPNPKTLARAPELDAADVRPEIFLRILRRDPRLNRVAPDLDVVLRMQADLRQRLALGHPDLRLHQVDARHDFGNSVLDLDPGIHFDEVMIPCSRIY